MHPLADTQLGKAFPTLCCCLRLCSEEKGPKNCDETRDNIKGLSARLDDIIRKAGGDGYVGTSFTKDTCNKFGISHKDDHKGLTVKIASDAGNPFAAYGFGIKAWIKSLSFLFFLYIILSCFAFIIMSLYSDSGFHGLDEPASAIGKLTYKYMLGNVGFASSECLFQYAGLNGKSQELKCNKGTISDIFYAGIVASKTNMTLVYDESEDYAGDLRVGNDFCGDPKRLPRDGDCSEWLDRAALEDAYTNGDSKCKGETNCTLDLTRFLKDGNASNPRPDVCSDTYTQIYI